MITVRPALERGHFNFGWLDTRHSFSFGDYRDPAHDGFRVLRVINEDVIQPGQGFGTHGHRDMEIFTWVLSGALAHRDSEGHQGVLRPGDAQRMSAGSGIRHSEFNHSTEQPVHLLQIWVVPRARDLAPGYQDRPFPQEERRNRLRLVASPDEEQGSLPWNQDARLYATLLDPGASLEHALAPGRGAWVQVARGSVELNGVSLGAGDGAAADGESLLRIRAGAASEVLLFDLP
jgi:redox-sensitive bicupin YhaK (pirin superfamily)